MKRGRPPKKSALVDAISGPEETKQRLRVILATVAGELTIPEACKQLKIGETRFYDLRAQALEAAFKGILPGVPGLKITPRQQDYETRAKVVEIERERETKRKTEGASEEPAPKAEQPAEEVDEEEEATFAIWR